LSHFFWAFAGLIGMVVTGLLTVTDRFGHRSNVTELTVAVLLGVMTMIAFAPWKAILSGTRQRREIRDLTDQVRRTGHQEPLRTLLRDGDDEVQRLRRAIHDRLSEATAHRLEAGHLRRTMTDSIRRETGLATGRLQKEVHTDVLTGIGNRRALTQHLGQMLKEARRRREQLTVLVIDVDRFKPINDRLGHAVGDECLACLGRILGDGVRGDDRAFRLGGDEFVVLMPGATTDIGVQIAQRLGMLYSQIVWPHTAAPRPTLSMGVASAGPGQIEDPKELLRRADMAMYASKRQGRARITTYSEIREAA
jgi:diguanylate cyclase (GGDEF)-like protein